MKIPLNKIIRPFLITLIFLIVLEIITSSFVPFLGLTHFYIPFNLVILFYLAIRLETSFTAVLVFIIQYFHSFFTIENWAVGTFIGILICKVVAKFRDLIQISSYPLTVLVVQIYLMSWHFANSLFLYFQSGGKTIFFGRFLTTFIEGLLASLISYHLFSLLDKIWFSGKEKELGGV
ncbi:MAG: hypothetical protein ACHQYQ_03365 [Bacteriovoracales bacterium]